MAETPTAPDFINAITAALKAQDVNAVESLLHLMATRFPVEAQDVVDTLKVGVAFANEGLL
jgi:hypothetical protein